MLLTAIVASMEEAASAVTLITHTFLTLRVLATTGTELPWWWNALLMCENHALYLTAVHQIGAIYDHLAITCLYEELEVAFVLQLPLNHFLDDDAILARLTWSIQVDVPVDVRHWAPSVTHRKCG